MGVARVTSARAMDARRCDPRTTPPRWGPLRDAEPGAIDGAGKTTGRAWRSASGNGASKACYRENETPGIDGSDDPSY
jgi:hypothetical protein